MTDARSISRRPLRLALVLFTLLPIVAALQYYWVTEWSQSERVRLQATLNSAITRLAEDVDRELLQLYQAFQFPPGTTIGETQDALILQSQHWQSVSETPELIETLYWVRVIDEQLLLYVFDPIAHTLDASAPLPSATALVNGALDEEPERIISLLQHVSPPHTRPLPLIATAQVDPNAAWPPRFIPTKSVQEFIFFSLDMRVMEQRVLPALVDAHFPAEGGTAYDVLITDRAAPHTARYQSHAALALSDFSTPDATAELGVPDWPLFLSRTVADSLSASMLPFMARQPALANANTEATARFNSFPRTWTLYAKHQSGSVDTIAARLLQRNLAVSVGVLAILGAAIGLIVRASQQAQQLADRQMAFVANVSHELRTPIAVMHAAGENLRDGLIVGADEARSYGTLITQESQNLQNLVEGALTYAGVGLSDPLATSAPVNLLDVIDDAVYRLRGVMQASQRIERDVPDAVPMVRGDAKALTAAVQNLIHNALKYGGPDVRVRLEVRVQLHSRSGGDRLLVTISDDGPGIPMQERATLFEPFVRGQLATKLKVRGNGLGLSIVKRVVDAHGGSIAVESGEPRGIGFQITLPVWVPEAEA
ncbi:MAG: HAMP domain-containing sensor histidine kinase [Bacteroidota bacterium]